MTGQGRPVSLVGINTVYRASRVAALGAHRGLETLILALALQLFISVTLDLMFFISQKKINWRRWLISFLLTLTFCDSNIRNN